MLRLLVVEGRDAGGAFTSAGATVTIGTASDNDLPLADPFVSRHHGRLSATGDQWHYRDLGSTNGSSWERDGQTTALAADDPEVALQSGDVLRLGETALRVTIEARAAAQPEHTMVASRPLPEAPALGEHPPAGADGLAALYRLEQRFGLAFDPEETLDAVLSALLAEFPGATHALLLLLDKKTRQARRQVAMVRGQEGRAQETLPVSMSVAERVLHEGRSMLFRDVPAEFAGSQSAAAAGITSTLCAPLWTGEETVGLIQVESRGRGAGFTEADLERLGLIANRAALAIIASELRDAEQRSRMVQDLSAMITHDLKGPLTSIMGFLELLSGEALEAEQKEFVEIALASSRWLATLIAGILDVAKMESGEATLETQPLVIAEEIAAALALTGYQLREKGIHVEVVCPDDLPRAQGDREVLRRVIVNLVGNAVKFAPSGSGLTLSATLTPGAESVIVSVQDQGPGISREYQSRIFDKFVQVAGAKSAEKVSVGLGLAFCRLAVEAQGGEIWVDSELGKGACFSFSVPRARETDGP